jgi:hypothetical protein
VALFSIKPMRDFFDKTEKGLPLTNQGLSLVGVFWP